MAKSMMEPAAASEYSGLHPMTIKRTTGLNSGKAVKGAGGKAIKPSKMTLHKRWLEEHGEEYRSRLLRNIKARLPKLDKLLRKSYGVFRAGEGSVCDRWEAMVLEISS